jgi:hypothetical protein
MILSSTARRLVIGCLVMGACAPGPRHPGFSTPESMLERQLLGRGHPLNKRGPDGGMLFYAELDPSDVSGLRVPFDVLKMQCENRGGTFTPSAPPQNAGASLAPKDSDTPDAIRDALSDADQRHVFGEFECSGLGTWVAEIQPNKLTPAKRGIYRVELYLRARETEVATAGGDSSGLPPLAAGAADLPPPAEGPSLAPPAAAPPAPSSPLDQQPPSPAPTGDKLLADPRPFGISLGNDSPDIFASKLHIDPNPKARCAHAAGKGMTIQCWQAPGGSQALALEAQFADVGNGPVIAEFELRYPASAFAWLERNLVNVLGPSDAGEGDEARSWSWLHTTILLSHDGGDPNGDTLVHATHKPTLDRAFLPPKTPGRDQLGPSRIATPWQLQLGYEPAQLAQSKLRAAGFEISSTGCSDGGSHALPILTRTCPLRAARMEGLRAAWVRIVDLGDGRPRLAELEYDFDNRARADTERELQTQYGAPIPSQGGAEQWWTGAVGITITPNGEGFSVRYFHGRLLQIFILATNKSQVAGKAAQRQGL